MKSLEDQDQRRPSLLPIFLDLEKKGVLLVGGGAAALEKLEKLWPSKARIQVVARRLTPAMRQRLLELGVAFAERAFEESDLEGQFLLISAVTDPRTHAELSALARAKNILVNTVDAPESTDFYFGAQVERGPLQLAISTQGLFPGVARALRLWLEAAFPAELEEELSELVALRHLARTRIPDPVKRMQALRTQLSLWLSPEEDAPREAKPRHPLEPLSHAPGAAI